MITHPPVVVGLTVCRDVSKDVTGDLTIFRSFTGMSTTSFPAQVTPFCVVVTLTDGEGDGRLELRITKLDDPSFDVARVTIPLRFPNRLQHVDCVIRVTRCVLPSAGVYLVSLFLDDEWIAQRSLQVR